MKIGLGLLKIAIFWIKNYDIIISVHDVTKKIFSRYLNHIVYVVKSSQVNFFFQHKNLHP